MSRFDASRRARIAAWTGAALAWGTVVAVVGQQQSAAEPMAAEPDPSLEVNTVESGSVPTMPANGLVIIRHEPSAESVAEVRTVFVPRATPVPAAPAPAPAPAPESGGS